MKAQGQSVSLFITVDENWYSAIASKVPSIDSWIERQVKKGLIERICSENFLVPDLTIADLTESEKTEIRDKVRSYNKINGMLIPTIEQVEHYVKNCEQSEFLTALEFAISHIWACDCFRDHPDTLRHAVFYLENF
jgi:hypothetical protein